MMSWCCCDVFFIFLSFRIIERQNAYYMLWKIVRSSSRNISPKMEWRNARDDFSVNISSGNHFCGYPGSLFNTHRLAHRQAHARTSPALPVAKAAARQPVPFVFWF